MVAVWCPECGANSVFDVQLGPDLKKAPCERCGVDLSSYTVPKPRACERFGVVCAHPCGRSFLPMESGDPGICEHHTPVRGRTCTP